MSAGTLGKRLRPSYHKGMSERALRAEPALTVECLSCGHVGDDAALLCRDHSGHADRRCREGAAMQQVRKPERARDPQAPNAASEGIVR